VPNDKKNLVENFLSLSILQGANMILPFVTLPYLVRVLEVDNFGLVNFALSIIGYFNILVSFGFELSATRKISMNRDNGQKLSEIFSAVTCIKAIMFFSSLLILTLLVFFVDALNKYMALYYVTFGIVLGNILFPTWFFQGIEKMKFITMINVVSKVLFTIFIFVLVQEKNDYIYVPLLNSLGAILGGAVALRIIFRTYAIKFYIPTKHTLWHHLKDSYYYFVSRIANNGSRYLATTIIGAYFGNTIVGYYVLVEKLFYAFATVGGVISQTIFPYMSRTRDLRLIKKIIGVTLVFAIPVSLALMYFNEFFLELVFDVKGKVVSTIFLLVFSGSVFSVVSAIIGYPLLAAFGYPGHANNSLIYSSIIYLIYIVIAVMATKNIFFVSFSLVVYTISGLLFRVYYINKTGLLNINPIKKEN
jgi:PST family polysaccharide transporter